MCIRDRFETLKAFAGEIEKKVGYVMWPIRTAISGKQNTPGGATEIMDVLGKEAVSYTHLDVYKRQKYDE